MPDSFTEAKRISYKQLQSRLERVKELRHSDLEAYEIHKDTATGEHYLLYYYEQQLIADNNHKETYYHFMPLSTNDVIAMALGEELFDYPEHWNRPFLRNSSTDDSYVWFDPAHQAQFAEYEQIGLKLAQKLQQFKQNGEWDEAKVQKLLDELDRG